MWLLEAEVRKVLTSIEQAGFKPSAEQLAHFTAFTGRMGGDGESRILTIAGDKAEIAVRGVLTASPSILAMLFGGGNTTYAEIISALSIAEQTDDVKSITLSVDSPGGHIDGLFQAMEAIRKAEKPINGVVVNMAASAAYMLISQADKVLALNEASRVGSIGIMGAFRTKDDEVIISSSKAPNKNPDVTTEEGRSVIQKELDGLHDLFVSGIARGRGVSVEDVNNNFGKGSMLLAREAKARKMIDAISSEVVGDTSGPVIMQGPEGALKVPVTAGPTVAGVNQGVISAGATPPFKDYPISGKSWDSTAAVRRWREQSGSTEAPSATYKNGFFWYDTEAPENFGSYKLPFVDVENGSVKAVRNGVNAANGAMQGARGGVQIPAADRTKVQAHIDKYRDKITKQDQNKEGKGMTKEELKAENPALYAELVQEGVKAERDRVQAHMTMGEAFGAMDTATKAIKDGSGFTASIQAEYMAAGNKKKETVDRAGDNPDLNIDSAAPAAVAKADLVAAEVERLTGVATTAQGGLK